MHRCLDLAQKASGKTAPNPMVGAVLVYNGTIIGEGYHKGYGQPHAEVNCLNSVSINNALFIKESVLYVSLEPCCHFGKTPPCTDVIISKNISHVIVGCRDSYEKVNGTGIEKLKEAGIKVETGILEKECRSVNRRFFCFQEKKRPYIILKWAQTADGFIDISGRNRTKISNEFTDRLVHKWRAEEAAIFVGTNTLIKDDPALTVRLWAGKNPVRIAIDNQGKVPESSKIFDKEALTIIMNKLKNEKNENLIFYARNENESFADAFVRCLNEFKLQSVLIEGGAKMLNTFLDLGLWDEVRVITNTEMIGGVGTKAPLLKNVISIREEMILGDRIAIYKNNKNEFV